MLRQAIISILLATIASPGDGSPGDATVVTRPASPTQTRAPAPTSTDGVLADLFAHARWSGAWRKGKAYAIGDVVSSGGTLWLAYAAGASAIGPSENTAQF